MCRNYSKIIQNEFFEDNHAKWINDDKEYVYRIYEVPKYDRIRVPELPIDYDLVLTHKSVKFTYQWVMFNEVLVQ